MEAIQRVVGDIKVPEGKMLGTATDLVAKKYGVTGMRAMTAHSIAYQAEANEVAGELKQGGTTIDAGILEDVLNRFNAVCNLAARLCHELEDHPDRAAKEFNTEELLHHSVSDYSTEIRQELQDLVADLNAAGAQDSKADAEDQKIVVVIEGGMVQQVLSAKGGFSVAVIDYDKNADMDDLVVIPQGDGEKNAYALAAIHEPEVTPATRVNELYSAVVEAKPAAEDEDSPRPRL